MSLVPLTEDRKKNNKTKRKAKPHSKSNNTDAGGTGTWLPARLVERIHPSGCIEVAG